MANMIRIVLFFAIIAYDIPLLIGLLNGYIAIPASVGYNTILILSIVPLVAILRYKEK